MLVNHTFAPHLDGYHDVADQMIRHLRERAARALRDQELTKAGLTSIAAFEEYRTAMRLRFLEAIGGLPVPEGAERPPLHPEITGTIDRGEFRIEKLLYQSLPDFYVTANVYLPRDSPAGSPAVIFLCGHFDQGKAAPEYQAACADLARNGFVVLAMDPPGQGERYQYWEPETSRRVVGWSTVEHTYAGIPVMLQGASIARWFTWDALRAFEYLAGRPEVDPARIAVTGNSGGGVQSVFLMLAEPRLAAAAPCTFVMSLESYLHTGQAQDSEQLLAGAFVHGPDHDDYLTALAPRPVLLGAAAYDFFPIEGSLAALASARRIYALYGAPENVAIAVSPTRHEYSRELRGAVVNWFRRHLAQLPANFAPEDPDPAALLPAPALNATPRGQVLETYRGSRTLSSLSRELAAERPPNPPLDPDTLRAELRSILGLAGMDENSPIHPRIIMETVAEGYPLEKIFFFSEPGICVAGLVVHPRGNVPPPRTDLVLLEDGTNSLPAERTRVEALLRRGHRVFLFDPRGVGAVASRPLPGGHPHDTEWRLGCDAMMLGTSTLGLRVFDVLRGLAYLRSRRDVDPNAVALHGVGSGAHWAWYAAALDPHGAALTVEGLLYSYRHLAGARYYAAHRYGMKNLAYGLLRHHDLADLLPALAPRHVRILAPVDAHGEPVSATVYRQRVLAEAGAAGRLPRGWEPEVE